LNKDVGHIVIYSTDTLYKQVINVLEGMKKEGLNIKDIEVEDTEYVDEW